MKYIYNFFFLCLLACTSNTGEDFGGICSEKNFTYPVKSVSLKDAEQIAQSNGKFIKVEGVIHYNFEDVALYPSNNSNPNFALWLNLQVPDSIPEIQLQKMDGKRVIIVGKVNLSRKGHLNDYFGTLDSAFCLSIK